MPYIRQFRRNFLQEGGEPSSPGELNYLFTSSAKYYVAEHGLSYQTINDVLGALEGAKLEFYRRVAVPYETQKIEENGDVYE